MKKIVLALILALSFSLSVYAEGEKAEAYSETAAERTLTPIEGMDGFYISEEGEEMSKSCCVCDAAGNPVSDYFLEISPKAGLGGTLKVAVRVGMSDRRVGVLNSSFKLIVPCEYGQVEIKEQNGIIYAEAPRLFTEGVDYYDLEGNKIENLYELLSQSSESVQNTEAIETGCDSWALEDIKTAIEYGIVPSSLQSDYKAKITRREFCELAMETYFQKKGGGLVWQGELENPSTPFTDADNISVSRAFILGVVSGTGEGKFSPDNFITRQEAAVMLLNLAHILEIDYETENAEAFVDESYFADWAKSSIYKICAIKSSSGTPIMAGTGEGKFSPWYSYQRQQAIVTMKRIFETPADTSEAFRLSFKADFETIAESYTLGEISQSLFNDDAYNSYISKWQETADTAEKSNYIVELDDAYRTTARLLKFCDYLYNETDVDKTQLEEMSEKIIKAFKNTPYMTEDEILSYFHGAEEFAILDEYNLTEDYLLWEP